MKGSQRESKMWGSRAVSFSGESRRLWAVQKWHVCQFVLNLCQCSSCHPSMQANINLDEREVSLKEGERENKGLTVMTSSSRLQWLFCFYASGRVWLYFPAGAFEWNILKYSNHFKLRHILCNHWSYDRTHPITILKQIYITWVANFKKRKYDEHLRNYTTSQKPENSYSAFITTVFPNLEKRKKKG